ncbi:hypothetical protein ACFQU7_29015 [Pseudoroseomonas wenyumeiae]
MTDAVIVSTARTPIGRAYRGSLNNTHGADLAAHAIGAALARAGVEPEAVEEVILGCGYPEGATGGNVARHAALRAGLPVSSAAQTVSRFCASGLEAIAAAAKRIIVDKVPVAVAGGVESISLVQPHVNRAGYRNAWLEAHRPHIYDTMIDTADLVAERYGISREAQDAFALESQRRTAAAQQARRFDGEIVPIAAIRSVPDKDGGTSRLEEVTLERTRATGPTPPPKGWRS